MIDKKKFYYHRAFQEPPIPNSVKLIGEEVFSTTDKEQIEGMAKTIIEAEHDACYFNDTCDNCKYQFHENCFVIQKVSRLHNAGYHKTIWHKVADSDFPPTYKKVLFKLAESDELTVGFLLEDGFLDLEAYPETDCTSADIIAWTELPEYKE